MENIMMDMIDEFLDIEEEEKEIWKVKDDLKADWCLDKIRESKAEYNRFEMVAKAKIQQIQEVLKKQKQKCDSEVSFFEGKLREYFETVKTEDTTTLKKYKLPSGQLKMKKSSTAFDYDKKKLVETAEKYENMKEYIKIEKDFKWADFKKKLDIKGNHIVDKETGEIVEIEGLKLKTKPEEFSVEV